jgi:predicted  nucleic acid-binding Zn-ribbon protein
VATKRELERLLKEALARGDRLEKANERLEKKLDEMMERQEQLQTEIRDLVRKLNEALVGSGSSIGASRDGSQGIRVPANRRQTMSTKKSSSR